MNLNKVLIFLGAGVGAFVGWYYYNDPKSIALGAIIGGFMVSMLVGRADY